MALNSIDFLLFLPTVAVLYYILPSKLKPVCLLAASLYFYACFGTVSIVMLLFTAVTTYCTGRILDRKKYRMRERLVLIIAVFINLAVLFFYKYLGFAADIVNRILSVLNIPQMKVTVSPALPVGISFYTFQALGYLFDVYRGKIRCETNFLYYVLFISFFPHITSGPIARADRLLPQLKAPKGYSYDGVRDGILLFLWGLFLKLVLANRIALYVDTVYQNYEYYHGRYTVIAILLYSLQIYTDFYGYTMLASGAAKILGIDLAENFRAPYLSPSVAGFWRSWHMSLTTWFRDYIYIPLGGSRKGTFRKYLNKMAVFLLSGLWHGASFGFLIWGGLNGLYQILEEVFIPAKPVSETVSTGDQRPGRRVWGFVRGCVTYLLISVAWVFFRANGAREAVSILRAACIPDNAAIFSAGEIFTCGVDLPNAVALAAALLILLFADICTKKNIVIREKLSACSAPVRVIFIALSVLTIMMFGLYGPGFNAADFIYYQF